MEIIGISVNSSVDVAARQGQARQYEREAAPSVVETDQDAGDQLNAEFSPNPKLDRAMEQIQKSYDVKVELEHDEESGRDVVKILSSDGQRLIRQIPPKAAIALADKARQGHGEGILDSLV